MKKQIARLFCSAMIITVAMGSLVACDFIKTEPDANEAKYNDACARIESGDYEEAYTAFKDLGDYKDSEKYLSRFMYFPSVVNYELYDRSGVMTITLGSYNLPVRMLTEGTIDGTGDYTKDGWYTYDAKGNMLRQAMTYNDDFAAYDYTYDANNRIVKAEYLDGNVVKAVHEYGYDENGLLIRESYAENGVIYYDYANSYDANGNLIKSVFETTDGDYVYDYVYNTDGQLVNERGESPYGNYYTNDYTYNEAGQLTEKVYSEDGELNSTLYCTYDNAGNCIKEEWIYPDETKDVYTKEYDENGNLTKEVHTYADGTVESVEMQYLFTYVAIDVPEWTMNQILGIFDII